MKRNARHNVSLAGELRYTRFSLRLLTPNFIITDFSVKKIDVGLNSR